MAAPVPEGVGRAEAGRTVGMDRQAVRDRAPRDNAEEPEGLMRCRERAIALVPAHIGQNGWERILIAIVIATDTTPGRATDPPHRYKPT